MSARSHDERVTELLQYNNDEVEKRRMVERAHREFREQVLTLARQAIATGDMEALEAIVSMCKTAT